MKKIIFLITLTFCILSCSTENPIAPKTENTNLPAFVEGYVTLNGDPIDAIVSVYYDYQFIANGGTDANGYYRVYIGSQWDGYTLLCHCNPALKYGLEPQTKSIIFHCPSTECDFSYPMP
jgi:hypothetical protein